VLLARGRTALLHRIRWLEFLLFILPIAPMVIAYGIVGAAITLVVTYAVSLMVMAMVTARELEIHVNEYFSVLGSAITPALIAFASVFTVDVAVVGDLEPSVAKWGGLIAIYFTVFAVCVRYLHWPMLTHLRQRLRA
jgi:O-antigen/teichoic acid export membrane protein